MRTQKNAGSISKRIAMVVLVIILATGCGQSVKIQGKLKSGSRNFKTELENSFNTLAKISQ